MNTSDPILPLETLPVQLDGVQKNLRIFPGISGSSFQHSDDSSASSALQGVPLFPQLFSMLNSNYLDQKNRMGHLTYELRLGPTQGAALYSKCVQACRILDLPQLPEFYLNTHPMINAYSSGVNQPIVSLSYGCVAHLSEAELLAVIGHELGHIKCHHGFNQSLASLFAQAGVSGISNIVPVIGATAVFGFRAALGHWSRMAEFSCDRAAILVVQDPQVVAGLIAKIAGFYAGVVPDFNFESLYTQLDDYDKYDQNAWQSLVKLEKVIFDSIDESNTHPSPVLRIKRILDWGKSDHYEDILAGKYTSESSATLSATPMTNTIRCASCGTALQHDAKFCSRCGHRA